MNKTVWILMIVLLTLPMSRMVLSMTTGHADQAAEQRFSQAELALLGGLRSALNDEVVRVTTRDYVLRQLRTIPPVAWVEGFWATPLDFAQLLDVPAVRAGIESSLPPPGGPALELLHDPRRLRQLTAIVFSPGGMRELLRLPYVGDLARSAATKPSMGGVVIAPVKDVEWAVVERTPPYPYTTPEADLECYFFCGDSTAWDFDGDGVVNARDDDDDGDGAADANDAYPYWPGASSCACGGRDFVGVTEAFSSGITKAVLAAFDLVTEQGASDHAVTVGAVPGTPTAVRLVFPPAVGPDKTVSPPLECPDSNDPNVQYVSADPNACAAIRFRCQTGQVAFYNACGCGCLGGR